MTTQRAGTWLNKQAPDAEAYQNILRYLRAGESIDYYLAFDFDGRKVMALTSDRVMVADRDGSGVSWEYRNIAGLPSPSHDRAVVIQDADGDETTYRVGDAAVAARVREEIRSRVSRYGRTRPTASHPADPGGDAGIAERVRFWEEQDKINQELIPRVIRQHELLTQHIGEHDNLPAVVSQAVAQALAETRADLERRYSAAVATAREEMTQQYTAAFEAAKAEIAAQAQADLQQAVSTVKQEGRRGRALLIAIATAGVAVGLLSAAISIGIIIG